MDDTPSPDHKFHRRSIRLQGYDYRAGGLYFVTLCTHDRVALFGSIINNAMLLNDYGRIVQEEWERTAVVRPNVELDMAVIMPNHLHGIIVIVDDPRATGPVAPTTDRPTGPLPGSLGAIIGQFKTASTRRINILRDMPGARVWQRNYYEHIIRNQESLNQIRQYILNNPAKWAEDSLYPTVGATGPVALTGNLRQKPEAQES